MKVTRIPTGYFLFVSLFILSCSPKSHYSSLKEAGFHGPVKKMMEEHQVRLNEASTQDPLPMLSVQYFDQDGNIEKLEKKNEWVEGVAEINYTALYTWKDGKPMLYTAVDKKNTPVENATYTWKDDRHYSLVIERKDGVQSTAEYNLNEQGRLIEMKSRIVLSGDREYLRHVLIGYDAKGNINGAINYTDNKKVPDSIGFVQASFDAKGNITRMFIIQKNKGDTVGIINRQFEYY